VKIHINNPKKSGGCIIIKYDIRQNGIKHIGNTEIISNWETVNNCEYRTSIVTVNTEGWVLMR